MAYNDSMRKNDKVNNITTEGVQFYGRNNTFVAGFLNEVVLLKIHPVKPEHERTQNNKYDYKKQIAVALSPDKAVLMGKLILEDIIPALEKGEECTRAISTSRMNVFLVSTGVKLSGGVNPYFGIFKKLNEESKPEEVGIFELLPQRTITEYNHATGDFTTECKYTDVFVFGKFLASCDALFHADTHSDKYINRFMINRNYEFQSAVTNKLGIENYGNRTNYVNRNTAGSADNLWDTSTPGDSFTSSNDAEISTASIDSLSELF